MKESFISCAQECEDLIAYHVLKHSVDEKLGGVYLDIGANDPVEWSVTKTLYDKGWHGVNIEPLENKYRALCQNRQRDINLWMGVSNSAGELDLLQANDLSTFNTDTQDRLQFYHKDLKENVVKVKVDTLTNILDSLKDRFKEKQIHFCKIDVEDYEYQVLSGFDLSKYRPWIFCIEAREYDKWEHLILREAYQYVFSDGLNRWYVADERSDLKSRFIHSEKLVEKYRVYRISRYKKHVESKEEHLIETCRQLKNYLRISAYTVNREGISTFLSKVIGHLRKAITP